MSKQLISHDKASMADLLHRIADQMAVLIEEAGNLENACGWYYDDDPQYGGPRTADQLKTCAMRLRTAYMDMALAIGLDPCEQLPSTKERMKRAREIPDINFDE